MHILQQGFDEYMNIVLDEAEEITAKTGAKRSIGRILLKGDCITLMQRASPEQGSNDEH
jgi:small nuclear ribonucleoprotein E